MNPPRWASAALALLLLVLLLPELLTVVIGALLAAGFALERLGVL
jgi:hypothetical protein